MPSTDIITKVDVTLQEPPLYKVIYFNDSVTTVEFVIESLIQFFGYSVEAAAKITQDVHEEGSAVVAVLPFEIAEQKSTEVTLCARNQNFPLQVKVTQDSV